MSVASIWSRIRARFRPPADEVERYSISDYSRWLTDGRMIYGTTAGAWSKTEEPEQTFTAYCQQVYKSDGPVFATVLARMMLFTEARFQWQQMRGGRPGDLFGTGELGVLEFPWPNGTTGELLARMEQDVSLSGNFYAVRQGSRIRRLRPDWVTIALSAAPAEAVESDVVGYAYTPGGKDARPELFLPEDVCHWSPIPDPDAQYRGMSWLTPILAEVTSDQSATRHKQRFFDNGATLGPIVIAPAGVTPQQFREFLTETNRHHQGVENAYKPMYIAPGSDVKMQGTDLRQIDFKATQGAGETRICAAGGVPPIIVGLSEGLDSATYSNYGSARRKFGDHWARPQWRMACAALQSIMDVPTGARLWYDARDIAFLREDQKDAAEIQQTLASTIRMLVDAGFEPESVVAAVEADDRTLLRHSGLYSVQLQRPGSQTTEPLAVEAA